MRSINFNGLDSFEDFGLILKKKTIETPSVKTNIVDVPGRRIPLDLTEFFGSVMYNQRTLTFEFKAVDTVENLEELMLDITNKLQGQAIRIIDNDLPDFYYVGRITLISKVYNDRASDIITFQALCEPFKKRLHETRVFASINGKSEVVCFNLNQDTIPRIVCSDEINATFNGKSYIFENGENIRDIVFVKGNNVIEFDGIADVEIFYQEGGI